MTEKEKIEVAFDELLEKTKNNPEKKDRVVLVTELLNFLVENKIKFSWNSLSDILTYLEMDDLKEEVGRFLSSGALNFDSTKGEYYGS